MWTNKYEPKVGTWYLVKVDGKSTPMMWNDHNKFFADFCGKTYKFNQVDCWLDDDVDSIKEYLIACLVTIDAPIPDAAKLIEINSLILECLDTQIDSKICQVPQNA